MPQVKTGTVVSNKTQKTVIVRVTTKVAHPLYKKLMTKTQQFKAHSEQPINTGQTVKIVESRPIAKDKHFKVVEVVK